MLYPGYPAINSNLYINNIMMNALKIINNHMKYSLDLYDTHI